MTMCVAQRSLSRRFGNPSADDDESVLVKHLSCGPELQASAAARFSAGRQTRTAIRHPRFCARKEIVLVADAVSLCSFPSAMVVRRQKDTARSLQLLAYGTFQHRLPVRSQAR